MMENLQIGFFGKVSSFFKETHARLSPSFHEKLSCLKQQQPSYSLKGSWKRTKPNTNEKSEPKDGIINAGSLLMFAEPLN